MATVKFHTTQGSAQMSFHDQIITTSCQENMRTVRASARSESNRLKHLHSFTSFYGLTTPPPSPDKTKKARSKTSFVSVHGTKYGNYTPSDSVSSARSIGNSDGRHRSVHTGLVTGAGPLSGRLPEFTPPASPIENGLSFPFGDPQKPSPSSGLDTE